MSPSDVADGLIEALETNPGVLNLIRLEDAARHPDGDAVFFDVITAEANRVLHELRSRGVDQRGSIIIENVDASISERATRAARGVPHLSNFSPVWEEAEARIRAGGSYAPSWFALLVIAALIAAAGIFTNSQILIVGAMIVGPEYGAIISVALGINKRERDPVRRGLTVLFFGFLFAIVAAFIFSLAIRALNLEPQAFNRGIRPVSDFINTPNAFSVIVAVLAAMVGVLSITEAKTGALIGVFISVTTIPAAADLGLSSSFGNWSEARGAGFQLLLNVFILIAVGAAGLAVQRRIWRRLGARAGRP